MGKHLVVLLAFVVCWHVPCRTAPLNPSAFLTAADRPQLNDPELLTYAQLARERAPRAYADALGQLDVLTPRVGAGEVKQLRISVLHARELLDIFAYAYPPTAPPQPLPQGADLGLGLAPCRELNMRSGACDKDVLRAAHGRGSPAATSMHADAHADVGVARHADMWQSVRDDMEAGYQLLGDFQVGAPACMHMRHPCIRDVHEAGLPGRCVHLTLQRGPTRLCPCASAPLRLRLCVVPPSASACASVCAWQPACLPACMCP